jgi:hypothetical protein
MWSIVRSPNCITGRCKLLVQPGLGGDLLQGVGIADGAAFT